MRTAQSLQTRRLAADVSHPRFIRAPAGRIDALDVETLTVVTLVSATATPSITTNEVTTNLLAATDATITDLACTTLDVATSSSLAAATADSLGVAGATTTGSLGVTGAATVGTTLGVAGILTAASDIAVGGNAAVAGDVDVTGNADVTGAATVGTNLTVADKLTVVGDTSLDEFVDQRPRCDETPLPSTLPEHLVSKAYVDGALAGSGLSATFVTLSASPGLANERVLTGSNYGIDITDNGAGSTATLGLSDTVSIGGNALTPTTPNGSLAVGANTVSADQFRRSLVVGENTVTGSLYESLVVGQFNSVDAGTTHRAVVAGDENTLENGTGPNDHGAFVMGYRNVIRGPGGRVYGGAQVFGHKNEVRSVLSGGALLAGETNVLEANSGPHNEGIVIFGDQNIVRSGGRVYSGAQLHGYRQRIYGTLGTGTLVTGQNITVGPSTTMFGSLIGGRGCTYDSSMSGTLALGENIQVGAGSALNYCGLITSNARIEANRGTTTASFSMGHASGHCTSNLSTLICADNGPTTANDPTCSLLKSDNDGRWTAQSPGLHLAGENIRFGGRTNTGTTEFVDRRPRCNESTLPTTNDDDLASKAYVDEFGDYVAQPTPLAYLQTVYSVPAEGAYSPSAVYSGTSHFSIFNEDNTVTDALCEFSFTFADPLPADAPRSVVVYINSGGGIQPPINATQMAFRVRAGATETTYGVTALSTRATNGDEVIGGPGGPLASGSWLTSSPWRATSILVGLPETIYNVDAFRWIPATLPASLFSTFGVSFHNRP